jgi:transcriptional regulator
MQELFLEGNNEGIKQKHKISKMIWWLNEKLYIELNFKKNILMCSLNLGTLELLIG